MNTPPVAGRTRADTAADVPAADATAKPPPSATTASNILDSFMNPLRQPMAPCARRSSKEHGEHQNRADRHLPGQSSTDVNVGHAALNQFRSESRGISSTTSNPRPM